MNLDETMTVSAPSYTALPAGLALLRLRFTMRLLADAPLPEHKGAMLRGGFGYAFQRASCPPRCWTLEHGCELAQLCPFRWIFATPRPPGVEHLHGLQDIPRPFVIDPPADTRTAFRAGESLDFGVTLFGRAVDYLPYFLHSFEQLGRMGLGRANAPARLERVEALMPWSATGPVMYQDGRTAPAPDCLPTYTDTSVAAQAALLGSNLRLTLRTPLRLKARGEIMRRLDVPALVQAICWRLNALSIFHGAGPWDIDHRALVAQAAQVIVEQERTRWLDLRRTSTRGSTPETMPQDGLLGTAVLRNVPPAVRAILLAGSLVHVGKACTFGHGGIVVENVR